MVLDSKQMEWASREGLDTAALKKAKVPIFGKWYFPDLPDDVPLVNLSTGEVETFPAGYRAGAVLYVKEEDLKRAGLGPYKAAEPAPQAEQAPEGPGQAPPAPAPEAPAAEPVAVAAAAGAVAAAVAAAPAAATAPAPATHVAPAHPEPAHHAPAHGTSHGDGHGAAAHPVEHAHPGSRTYITIALILTVITAIEVAVYYIPALLPFIFPILLVLSAIKFVLVVGWFMHLKFDHISYTWYFGGGLALALTIVLSLIVLQIATHGLSPGDGNAHTYPAVFPGAPAPPAPSSGGGH
jgi:cytochrome c oxidase subunit IV